MDKERIERARTRFRLADLVGQSVKLHRASGGFLGLCPFHQERTPSFHLSTIRGTFKCFGCGAWGDVFDFVMLSRGLTFPQAVDWILGDAQDSGWRSAASCREELADDERRRVAHAHALWLKREPIEVTVAETYLRKTRGLGAVVLPPILGFVSDAYCSPIGSTTGALVAPLQNSAGHVTAVQQIFLNPHTHDAWFGKDGKRIKRTIGVMGDGAVRLGVPDTILGLAGSVEDALAASVLFSLPVWAVCGEARLSRVWIPPEIERVMIFADSDEAGRREAQKCMSAKYAAHAEVEIVMPDTGKDFVEMIQTKGLGQHGERGARTMEG